MANGQEKTIQQLAQESFDKTIVKYPKLADTNIKIKISKRGSAMGAAYTWWSVFVRPEKRQFFVKINERVKGAYICYQFDHLSDSSRDGVMGHELAHIDYFHTLNFFGYLKFIFRQTLPGGLIKSEKATDYHTIENGLGHELRAWSKETRERFLANPDNSIPKQFGSRYYTPEEIDSVMSLFPELY